MFDAAALFGWSVSPLYRAVALWAASAVVASVMSSGARANAFACLCFEKHSRPERVNPFTTTVILKSQARERVRALSRAHAYARTRVSAYAWMRGRADARTRGRADERTCGRT